MHIETRPSRVRKAGRWPRPRWPRATHSVTLAVALIGTVVGAGIAFAANDGNTSSLSAHFSPHRVPQWQFKRGELNLHAHTTYAHSPSDPKGAMLERLAVALDDDFKLDVDAVPTCDHPLVNLTMKQAVAACGKSRVGTGTARVTDGAHSFPACLLAFNAQPSDGKPGLLLYTRWEFAGPNSTIDCSHPAPNVEGNVTWVFAGELKRGRGDFGRRLVVDHISSFQVGGGKGPGVGGSKIALTDLRLALKRREYVRARCHDRNKTWNVKGKFTYTDGQSDTSRSTQTCRVAY